MPQKDRASGSRGPRKGNANENAICLILSEWAGVPAKKVTDSLFRRRTTNVVALDGVWEGSGDILAKPEACWPFATEAKKQENWELDDLFSDNKVLVDWWEQTLCQARRSGKLPLLIFTRNFRPIYCMMENSLWLKLKQEVGKLGPKLAMGSVFPKSILQVQIQPKSWVAVVRLDALTKMVPYSSVKALSRSSEESSPTRTSGPTAASSPRAA
jgi:hypothetical protein